MGGNMAGRLIDAGHPLVVFDRSEAAVAALAARGAIVAGSAAEVADRASTILVSLPTPDIVQSVITEALAGGKAVRTVIDLSTTGPRVAAVCAAALLERGIVYVDAPVSGGKAGAHDGKLTVMVACPKAVFADIRPILEILGKLFFVGETAGQAQVVKLGNNLIGAAVIALTSEALAMGVKAGVDPKVMVDIINVSSGRSSATQDKFPRAVLPRTFDFGFATGLSYKDVRLCVDEAEGLGVPMIVGGAVRQFLAVTNARFGPESDFTSMARVVEEWAGIEIKSQS
jgi:3-hydroxyisobutyrate dehydrogenase-like beta-hydroxyacid dehydrogenase